MKFSLCFKSIKLLPAMLRKSVLNVKEFMLMSALSMIPSLGHCVNELKSQIDS